MALKIVKELCTACGDCEPVCPTMSISPFKGVYKIDASTCSECEGDGEPGTPQCMEACMEDDCIVPA
ncbi:4Fe-4S binding protein [Allochromatium vinosum]|jgi:ferredoxin|uniref:4Fe-4S ferredoxin iron-sulfur binding domain protein n=1 Tax=Allochromatium vinosum (strain ATCC 17899 / DSM 180 / NBRC 103801 / NCIMB 10441 / D) TaxID=572477 RepID=D3RUE2_ALLVD|nr:4Fe-4S binding protein [Allochromatium vinosum]ADC62801.1 4Fe-4S ferredoxin iron-sulfur binding domain protein [Allochromatium vinosum DSM 180]